MAPTRSSLVSKGLFPPAAHDLAREPCAAWLVTERAKYGGERFLILGVEQSSGVDRHVRPHSHVQPCARAKRESTIGIVDLM
jgi:hypothetical protein